MGFPDFLYGGYFEPTNYTPDSGKNPICPFYQNIEIAAKFAGVEINPRKFCGLNKKREDTMGFLSGRRGTDYTPWVSCINIARRLKEEIQIAELKDIPLPDTKEEIGDIATTDIEKILAIRKFRDRKNNIISCFKQATFDLTTVPKKLPENISRHFEGVDSPKDITEERAINTARQFLRGLTNITGNLDNLLLFTARNCPQAPQSGFVGEIS